MFKQLFRYGRAGLGGALQQAVNEWLLLVLPVLTGGGILYWYMTRRLTWWSGVLPLALLIAWGLYSLLPGAQKRVQKWSVLAKREIRRDYLQGLFSPQMTASGDFTSHKVIQRDLGGINRLDAFYGTFFPGLFASGLSYLLLISLAIAWHSWLPLLPIACFLLMGVGMMLLQKISPNINRQYLQSFVQLGSRFLDDLGGMSTLVMYGAAKRYRERFAKDAEFFRGKTMALLKYQLQSLFILNGLVFAGMGAGAFVLWGPLQAGRLTLVQASVLWLLLAQLLVAERQLGYFFHIVMSTRLALANIFRIIAAGQETPGDENRGTFRGTIKTVHFHNAAFGYADGPRLWSDVSLTLQPGQLYGLVGENGTGKSTFAQVLRGQLALVQGKVTFDRRNAAAFSRADWLNHVGYLDDRPYLFSGTIAENIALGAADQPDWWAQVTKLGLCQFAADLPAGLQTQIGEDGRFLSPGQRQQIAFARLLLMHKDIYIFDEVTANIDAMNTQIIMAAIKQLSQRAIVLCITHEWRAIDQLDVIYFLADGQITSGTKRVLAVDNAAFRRLLDTQKELEAAG
ncbi:ATP-binding cassette domain-containing protein [Schleiferilactobacillus harbinensis]|uniref:ATP-binding cassette domain-containing protein n=1 Tax=Schleiferilactobacillus harbinensis TaxID=304207 RepID=UPI002F26DB26